jgi:hypothetical protein
MWLADEIGEPVHLLGAVSEDPILRLGPIEIDLAVARDAFSRGSS